jgi:SAM-dependent methyltransferase
MQARVNTDPTNFFADHPFRRADETEDRLFYEVPRMVNHIDDTAVDIIRQIYGKRIPPRSHVLDLMSSWVSHLPEDLPLKSLTGLGMNQTELEANRRLTDYVVHDLNENPQLPFNDGDFDAVICSVSIEYLIHPFKIFEEINRVLKPGGIFIVTFSNRWFPPKAITIWPELHEFERMGLVLEFFLKSGQYEHLQTYSMRGLPRPQDDKYYPRIPFSDPVYAVWGNSRKTR